MHAGAMHWRGVFARVARDRTIAAASFRRFLDSKVKHDVWTVIDFMRMSVASIDRAGGFRDRRPMIFVLQARSRIDLPIALRWHDPGTAHQCWTMHHGSVVHRHQIGTIEHRLLIERETSLHERRHRNLWQFDGWSAGQRYHRVINVVFARGRTAFVEAGKCGIVDRSQCGPEWHRICRQCWLFAPSSSSRRRAHCH